MLIQYIQNLTMYLSILIPIWVYISYRDFFSSEIRLDIDSQCRQIGQDIDNEWKSREKLEESRKINDKMKLDGVKNERFRRTWVKLVYVVCSMADRCTGHWRYLSDYLKSIALVQCAPTSGSIILIPNCAFVSHLSLNSPRRLTWNGSKLGNKRKNIETKDV